MWAGKQNQSIASIKLAAQSQHPPPQLPPVLSSPLLHTLQVAVSCWRKGGMWWEWTVAGVAENEQEYQTLTGRPKLLGQLKLIKTAEAVILSSFQPPTTPPLPAPLAPTPPDLPPSPHTAPCPV